MRGVDTVHENLQYPLWYEIQLVNRLVNVQGMVMEDSGKFGIKDMTKLLKDTLLLSQA